MATAIGTYVTLAQLRDRLGLPVDATRDALLTAVVDETNQWIESYTGRILAPIASTTYLFDGYGLSSPYVIHFGRLGARAVTLLEAGTDGTTFSTVTAPYSLRPFAQDRAMSGEPAQYLVMTNGYRLPYGYGNIRLTMTAGFEAIPDDVRAVAVGIATRWWHGRLSGQADVVGSVETGEPVVTKIVPTEFKKILDHYRLPLVR